MRNYVYGKPHDTRDLFDDYLDPGKTAIVSIDMHRGHLDRIAGLSLPGAAGARHRRADRRVPRQRTRARHSDHSCALGAPPRRRR